MSKVESLDTRLGPAGRLRRLCSRVRLDRLAVRTESRHLRVPAAAGSRSHTGNVVVNHRARFGACCRIHSGTNVDVAAGGVPRLGTRVYVAPDAVLLGGITVGDHALVDASSVVATDVPPDVPVAGAPARVIPDRASDRSMPEWFPSPEIGE